MTSSTLAYRAIGKETAAIAAAGVVLYLGVADSRGRGGQTVYMVVPTQ
jgi:hypothetical protein